MQAPDVGPFLTHGVLTRSLWLGTISNRISNLTLASNSTHGRKSTKDTRTIARSSLYLIIDRATFGKSGGRLYELINQLSKRRSLIIDLAIAVTVADHPRAKRQGEVQQFILCVRNYTVPSARLTLHSTKLCTKFKIFRKKIFFVTNKVTSETF